MIRPDVDELRLLVEREHGCMARLIQSVPVRDIHTSRPVWEGVVYIFALAGHSTATRAYAWTSSTKLSTTRRSFALLHQPPIDSPRAAVRAILTLEC